MTVHAYLQITMTIAPANREAAAKVYTAYRNPFLTTIPGASTKDLLIRDDDVQVLHGFENVAQAQAYLNSDLFTKHVFAELQPLWQGQPDVRIYTVA